MGRTRAFDSDSVVRAARTVFWRQGYELTSVPDLEAATGLSRSSLYNAFESKRGLFDAAVQSYLNEVIRPRLRPLQVEPVELGALTGYLTGLRDAFLATGSLPATSGCLLINAAAGPIADDAHVAEIVNSYRSEMYAAVRRGVTAHAAATAPSGPRAAPDALDVLAETVTGLIIAAFALARISPSEAVRSLDTARALVDGAV